MKKILLAAAVLVIVIAMGGNASALSNQSGLVDVTASIVGVCKFSATNGTIAFGALDQSSGAAATGVVTFPDYWCTKGLGVYTITADNGLHFSGSRRLKASLTADTIPYTFTFTASAAGKGMSALNVLAPLATSATIAAGAYDDVTADSYSDTITLTFSY
jgi:spore coat protein U-like protein